MLRLPVLPAGTTDDLDGLTVATPCDVPWESLAGDDRVRHCGRCRQDVYNVEALSRAEALQLIGKGERLPCMRLHRRPDGTLVTADCWARLRAARKRGWLAFAAALVVVGWAELCAMALGFYNLGRVTRGRTMGEPAAIQVPIPPAGVPAPLPAPPPPPIETMGKPAPPPEPPPPPRAEP